MKKLLILLVASACVIADGNDAFIGAYDIVTNNVASGIVSHDGKIGISPEGKMVKTGAGTLKIPSASVVQQGDFNLAVSQGAVSFDEAASGAGNEVPSVLQDKAAYWVAANDVDAHFLKEGDGVRRWYDVRETDTSAPKYYFARALETYTTSLPTAVEKDGVKAVYFGGVKSGIGMRFGKTDSDTTAIDAYHLFAVVGTYATQGAVFGSAGQAGNLFMYKLYKGTGLAYADPSRRWHQTLRSLTYVDGKRIDPYVDTPPIGRFHLFDTSSPISASACALFAQWGQSDFWGGDYIAEAIAFTNQLTDAECVSIRNYLAKKWADGSKATKILALDKNGEYLADATSADVGGNDLQLTGDGKIVKQGANAWRYRSADTIGADAAKFEGSLDIEDGTVALSSQAAIVANGGTKITASTSEGGNREVGVSAAADATVAKDGDSSAKINAIPADVKYVNVDGGMLQVSSARTNACAGADTYYVPIENGDFENMFTDDELSAVGGVTGLVAATTYTYTKGWRRFTNAAWVFDLQKWTGAKNVAGASGNAYNQNMHTPNGKIAVMLHQNGVMATPVTITEAGMYEFSLYLYSRATDGHLGSYVSVGLYDVSGGAAGVLKYDFGRAYYYEHNYRRIAMRAKVDKAGAYELRIRTCNITSRCLVFDDVRLRKMADSEVESGVWPIPGGDFEFDQDLTGADNFKTITDSPYANWTFNAGDGYMGVVNMSTTNDYGKVDSSAYHAECNETRGPYGGARQLLLSRGTCSAVATCTPPKGTYYLRADLAKYYNDIGNLSAKVKIGENEEIVLGTTKVANTLMAPYTWALPFSVSGDEQIAVTFTFTKSDTYTGLATGVNIDDVRLVTFYDHELVVNGGFETPHSGIVNWAKYWTKETTGSDYQVQPYSYLPEVFTSDPVEGGATGYFLYLERNAAAAQEVTFDRPGLYRLSFYAALSRRAYSTTTTYYSKCTPIEAWLKLSDSVTNVIGNTGAFSNTNFCQYVWDFRVNAVGTYKFGLQGTYVGKAGYNACIDAVSIRPVDETRSVAVTDVPFPTEAAVSIASGARMQLDFDGTNTVRKLKLGGNRVSGLVTAGDYPEYLSGRGAFNVVPHGFRMIVR